MDTPPESPLPPPLPEESFEELLARPSEDFESRRTLLRAFQESTGGEPHRTEIDAVFALVCTPEKAGIIVNPNQTPNFRLAPELVAMLRERLEEARARTSGAPLPH